MNTLSSLPGGVATAVHLADGLATRLLYISLEVAVLALAVAILCACLRGRAARLRSALWMIVLIKPLVGLLLGAPLPLVDLETQKMLEAVATNAIDLPQDRAATAVNASRATEDVALTVQRPRPNLSTLFVLVWILGLGIAVLAATSERFRVLRILRNSRRAPVEIETRYLRLARRFGLRHPPPLSITCELDSPALVGSLRPRVLLPLWVVEQASSQQLDWALAHELIHYRHLDHLVNLLRRISQALLFFHPAVWFAGYRWRRAAETACDRALVNEPAEARSYARVLVELQQGLRLRRRTMLAAGLYASRSQVGRRIETLLTIDFARPSPVMRSVATVLLLIGFAALPMGAERGAFAAPENAASFYAASLRSDIEEVLDSGWSFEFHARGYFEFGDRFRRPLKVGDGARLRLIERDLTIERRLELTSAGGEPHLRYFVAGEERTLDAFGRRWMAERLSELLGKRQLSKNEPRVRPRPRLLHSGLSEGKRQ